jgi:hypothetical protein
MPNKCEARTSPRTPKAAPVIAPKHATMQLLSAENSEGRKFVIYEWRGSSNSAPNNAIVPYLHIWSVADTAGDQSDAQLVKAARRVPYSMRITYPGPRTSAPGQRYSVFRNGELVYKGRSDKDGFTEALNADYLENWEIKTYK